MKQIIFPMLNLELNINPIAFTIFGVSIYWYAIIIVASIVLAMFLYKKQDGKFGISYDNILDLSLILIPVSLICARIYYIIFNLDYYTTFERIINVKDGGLAIYGGIVGGLIVAIIYCKKKKINLLDLLDYIVPCIALGQSIGRWGNFINIEAYGKTTNLPWKMGIQVNEELQYVHPTFFYESIATFIIFLILTKLSKNRKFKGEITYLYLILYTFIRFFIEILRVDSLMLGNIKISALVSITVCIISTIIFVVKLTKKKKYSIIEVSKNQ